MGLVDVWNLVLIECRHYTTCHRLITYRICTSLNKPNIYRCKSAYNTAEFLLLIRDCLLNISVQIVHCKWTSSDFSAYYSYICVMIDFCVLFYEKWQILQFIFCMLMHVKWQIFQYILYLYFFIIDFCFLFIVMWQIFQWTFCLQMNVKWVIFQCILYLYLFLLSIFAFFLT